MLVPVWAAVAFISATLPSFFNKQPQMRDKNETIYNQTYNYIAPQASRFSTIKFAIPGPVTTQPSRDITGTSKPLTLQQKVSYGVACITSSYLGALTYVLHLRSPLKSNEEFSLPHEDMLLSDLAAMPQQDTLLKLMNCITYRYQDLTDPAQRLARFIRDANTDIAKLRRFVSIGRKLKFFGLSTVFGCTVSTIEQAQARIGHLEFYKKLIMNNLNFATASQVPVQSAA